MSDKCKTASTLCYIASNDALIKFCGTDLALGERYRESFGGEVTFSPVMSFLANSAELMDKGHDFWSKPLIGKCKGNCNCRMASKMSKRGYKRFDSCKYARFYITERRRELLAEGEENAELPVMSLKRNLVECVAAGETFVDPFAYLMAYESEVKAMYSHRCDLSLLEKAALHYLEIGLEERELDYIKYIASYDDLVGGAVAGKPADQTWEEWIPAVGKLHYESGGRLEVVSGVRPVGDFFDPLMYIATYAGVEAQFKKEDGEYDNDALALAYITIGASNGLARNGFNSSVFLANYPELVGEDVYTNDEVDDRKVAKLWLARHAAGEVPELDKFDPLDFKETNELGDDADIFKVFVERKVTEHRSELKKQAKAWYRMRRVLCTAPKKADS